MNKSDKIDIQNLKKFGEIPISDAIQIMKDMQESNLVLVQIPAHGTFVENYTEKFKLAADTLLNFAAVAISVFMDIGRECK